MLTIHLSGRRAYVHMLYTTVLYLPIMLPMPTYDTSAGMRDLRVPSHVLTFNAGGVCDVAALLLRGE